MKKFAVGMMTIGVVLGLFAAKSVLYAGDTEPLEAVDVQTQDEETATWEAWRADFTSVLEADEEYAAAEAALRAYKSDDEKERARLEAVRDEIYYEIARPVYEDHFGPWEGDDDEFISFLAKQNQIAVIKQCTASAIEACGKGKVSSVTVTADGGCSFTCSGGTPIP